MQEQMRYVKGERNVDHCNSEAQSAAMYPDSMNHIKVEQTACPTLLFGVGEVYKLRFHYSLLKIS